MAKKYKSSIADLPEELISEILLKVPQEDIVRFTCVSKSYQSLISNPTFIEALLARSRKRSILLDADKKDYEDEGEGIMFTTLSDPITNKNPEHTIFSINSGLKPANRLMFVCKQLGRVDPKELFVSCSYDGLILLNSPRSQLYICNPVIPQFVALPPLCCAKVVGWGLVHNPSANRYKVYGVCWENRKLVLLTQGQTQWMQLSVPKVSPGPLLVSTYSVSVKKELHWLIVDADGEQQDYGISNQEFYYVLSIHIETERVRKRKFPLVPVKPGCVLGHHFLTAVGRSLCITFIYHTKLEMFLLRDRLWSKYRTVNLKLSFPEVSVCHFLSRGCSFLAGREDDPDPELGGMVIMLHIKDELFFYSPSCHFKRKIDNLRADQMLPRMSVFHTNGLASWI